MPKSLLLLLMGLLLSSAPAAFGQHPSSERLLEQAGLLTVAPERVEDRPTLGELPLPGPCFRISSGIDELLPPDSCRGEPPLLEVYPEFGPLIPLDPMTAGTLKLMEADEARAQIPDSWLPIEEYWENVTNGFDEWTRKVALGARYLNGNSKEVFIDLGVDFEHREETRLTQVNLGGQFGESNGVRGTNRWWANSNTDRDLEGKKWLIYTQVRDKYDQFENLDYRGTLSAGGGYRFYDTPEQRLITRLGPAVTYEIYNSPKVQRVTPDVFGEIEARWPLRKRVTAEHKTSLNPSLLDIQLLRITSTSGISWALDEAESWSLKLGFLWIYNGRPNEGRVPSDYTGTMSVVYLKK